MFVVRCKWNIFFRPFDVPFSTVFVPGSHLTTRTQTVRRTNEKVPQMTPTWKTIPESGITKLPKHRNHQSHRSYQSHRTNGSHWAQRSHRNHPNHRTHRTHRTRPGASNNRKCVWRFPSTCLVDKVDTRPGLRILKILGPRNQTYETILYSGPLPKLFDPLL